MILLYCSTSSIANWTTEASNKFKNLLLYKDFYWIFYIILTIFMCAINILRQFIIQQSNNAQDLKIKSKNYWNKKIKNMGLYENYQSFCNMFSQSCQRDKLQNVFLEEHFLELRRQYLERKQISLDYLSAKIFTKQNQKIWLDLFKTIQKEVSDAYRKNWDAINKPQYWQRILVLTIAIFAINLVPSLLLFFYRRLMLKGNFKNAERLFTVFVVLFFIYFLDCVYIIIDIIDNYAQIR
jgi:hypothetical protein